MLQRQANGGGFANFIVGPHTGIGSASIRNVCEKRSLLHRKQCHSPFFIIRYHTGVYMEIRGLVSRSGFLPPGRLLSKEKDGSDHALLLAPFREGLLSGQQILSGR